MTRSTLTISVLLVLAAGCPQAPAAGGDDEVGKDGTPSLGCLGDDQCPNPALPFCEGGECVACVSDDNCPDPVLSECTNGSCVVPCSVDALEPNDSHLAATMVDDFDIVTGSLCPGDEDWFTFTLTAPTHVGIFARYDARHGDLDFDLRRADAGAGDVVATADGDDIEYLTLEGMLESPVPPGAYAVRVHLDSGQGGLAYELRFYLLRYD